MEVIRCRCVKDVGVIIDSIFNFGDAINKCQKHQDLTKLYEQWYPGSSYAHSQFG